MKRLSLVVPMFALVACGGETPQPTPPPAPTMTAAPTVTAPPPVVSADPAPPPAPKPTMAELQKKTMGAFMAAYNAHDAKALAATYAADAIIAHPGPGGTWHETKGREEIQKHQEHLFKGYSDAKTAAERVFVNKDVVIVQWVMTGTNDGEFMEHPATKKPVGFHGSSVLWFNDDGLVAKEHIYYDMPTIMAQQGQGKQKARPVAALPTGAPEVVTTVDDKSVAAANAQYDAFNKHDGKAYGAAISADYLHIDWAAPEDVKGNAAGVKEANGLFKTFPDLNMKLDATWGFGDYVIVEMSGGGTMKGALGPLKATGKPVTVHMFEVNVVKDGKVAKTETYWNTFELVSQVMPMPKPGEKPFAKPGDKPGEKPVAKPK